MRTMKMVRLISALIVCVFVQTEIRAQGHWVTIDHDFGAFDEDTGMVYCEFRLVNDGTEPLAITNARANCGCTRPEYSTEPVAPGDTAVLKVGYDPKGRPGRFSKRIYVDCSGEPARSVLTIHGTVIGASNTLRSRYPIEAGPVKLRTRAIAYGRVLKGETMGQYIDAYNASADTIYPRVEKAPKYINVIVQPAAVPPGEQFILSTILHSNQTPSWGLTTDSLMLFPDRNATEGLKIETVAILEEDFSKLTPAQRAKAPVLETDVTSIDLGRILRDGKPIERHFTIKNRGASPLVIRAITCPDPAVGVTLKERSIKPGKSARVNVTVIPDRVVSRELLNARINIIANDPDHHSTMVRVVGEL